jgi:hypothetical protein
MKTTMTFQVSGLNIIKNHADGDVGLYYTHVVDIHMKVYMALHMTPLVVSHRLDPLVVFPPMDPFAVFPPMDPLVVFPPMDSLAVFPPMDPLVVFPPMSPPMAPRGTSPRMILVVARAGLLRVVLLGSGAMTTRIPCLSVDPQISHIFKITHHPISKKLILVDVPLESKTGMSHMPVIR